MNRTEVATPADSLAAALEQTTVQGLQGLARLFVDKPPKRKDQLVPFVLDLMQDDKLEGIWEKLTPLEQAAVAEAVHAPHPFLPVDKLRAKYGEVPRLTSYSSYREREAVLLDLFFHQGLLPLDLKERLRGFVPPPAKATIQTIESLPPHVNFRERTWDHKTNEQVDRVRNISLTVRAMEEAASGDVTALLRLVDAGGVSVGATGRPSGAAMTAIRGVLTEGDFYDEKAEEGAIRAFAWPLLLLEGGLAVAQSGRLRLTAAGKAALSNPPHDVLQGLWEEWLQTDRFDELTRIEVIKGQSGKGKRGLTDPVERREAIAEALAECPASRWVHADEFFRFMVAAGHDFEVTDSPWDLYFGEKQYGSLGFDGHGGWEILQARYALCFLFEVAATLGVIDVAYVPAEFGRPDYSGIWGTDDIPFLSRYDGLTHFRVTPLGAYLLGTSKAYTPAASTRPPDLRVLPTLEVAATSSALPAGERLFLDRFAKKTGERVWTLDRARILETLEEGGSIDELERFLRERSANALPPGVERLLADMRDRAGHLADLGPGRLVECADAALAALLAHDGHTKRSCRLAGDRHVFVPASSEKAFRRGLRELGYHLPPADKPGP